MVCRLILTLAGKIESIGLVQKTSRSSMKIDKITPTHTKDWYLKWVSTIILLVGIILTANNVYPYNLYVNVVALFGWIIVSIMWNDRALIVINVVGFTIYLNGIISYFV